MLRQLSKFSSLIYWDKKKVFPLKNVSLFAHNISNIFVFDEINRQYHVVKEERRQCSCVNKLCHTTVKYTSKAKCVYTFLSRRFLSYESEAKHIVERFTPTANSSIFAFHSTQGFTRSAPSLVFLLLPHDHSQQKWMKSNFFFLAWNFSKANLSHRLGRKSLESVMDRKEMEWKVIRDGVWCTGCWLKCILRVMKIRLTTTNDYEIDCWEWVWEERSPNNNNFYDLFFIIIFLEKHGFPIFNIPWCTFRPNCDVIRKGRL